MRLSEIYIRDPYIFPHNGTYYKYGKTAENKNLFDKILSEKELSHANLCLQLEKIIIREDEYGLRLEIRMKAPFLEKSYTDEIGMIYEEVSA